MNLKLLIIIFILGLTIGFFVFSEFHPTTGMATCFVENEPCYCDAQECVCGNISVDAELCQSIS